MSENDNDKLKPAEENPWYVLATICDKDDKDDKGIIVNDEVLTNCEVWNSWAWARLQENGDKGVLKIKTLGVMILGPKWEDIRERVEERLKKRLNYDNFSFLYGYQIKLDSTIFTKKVEFTNFIFPFSKTFEGSLIFSEAAFHNSIFYGYVNFNGTKFNDITEFFHTVFCGITHFIGQVDFKKNNIFAHSVFYHHVSISEAIFRKRSNFRNCEFKKTCDFTASIFAEEYPWFEGTVFNKNFIVTAHKYHWPKLNKYKQPLQEAKASCEILRAKMEAQGLHEQAHFFFRREMYFARKAGSFWQAIPNWLFNVVSDYGHSIFLPSIWLYNLCLASGLIFFDTTRLTFGGAMGLSVSNLLQITGLQRVYWSDAIECLPWGLKFLGGAQTLLAIPLLFLLLLGLRNRFRLK